MDHSVCFCTELVLTTKFWPRHTFKNIFWLGTFQEFFIEIYFICEIVKQTCAFVVRDMLLQWPKATWFKLLTPNLALYNRIIQLGVQDFYSLRHIPFFITEIIETFRLHIFCITFTIANNFQTLSPSKNKNLQNR